WGTVTRQSHERASEDGQATVKSDDIFCSEHRWRHREAIHNTRGVPMTKTRRSFFTLASSSFLALALGAGPVFADSWGFSGGSSGGGFLHHGGGGSSGGSSGGGFLHHGGGCSGGGLRHHGGRGAHGG